MIFKFLERRRRRREQRNAADTLRVEVFEGFSGPVEQIQPEPSPRYLEAVTMIDNVVRDCLHVSRRFGGIPAETSQHGYASWLFTALCSRGVSLSILAPCSPWAERMIEHWDYASMTGIVRSMLELRLALFYIAIEPMTRDEWECRWNVFNLHDCRSRIKLFEAAATMRDEPPSSEIAQMEQIIPDLQARLQGNPVFQGLAGKQQQRFLRGEAAYMDAQEDIAERAGFGRDKFRYFQRLLSSHVHALPMSFYRIAEDGRGRGVPNVTEEGYTSLCLTLASTLLVTSRDEFLTLFGGAEAVAAHIAEANSLDGQPTIST